MLPRTLNLNQTENGANMLSPIVSVAKATQRNDGANSTNKKKKRLVPSKESGNSISQQQNHRCHRIVKRMNEWNVFLSLLLCFLYSLSCLLFSIEGWTWKIVHTITSRRRADEQNKSRKYQQLKIHISVLVKQRVR